MRSALRALEAGSLPLAVAAAAFTVAVGLPPSDPDMWWHLASGRWMVEHGTGLRVDVFSSTATGEPYALGEWLGEVALYLVYAWGSWTGVAAMRAALIALAAFSVTRLALRSAPARVAIPLATLAVLLSKPTWTDRPQLFTLAFFPLLLDLCLSARSGSRAALVATVPLVAVWANVHGGYAVGVGILWIFALDAALERRALAGPLAAAAISTFVASVEPGALPLLRAASHVAGSTVRIVEETPVDVLTPFGMLFALFVGVTIAAFMTRGGSMLAALVSVPMFWLALSAQRHVPLFGFAVVPFVSGPLTSVVDEVGTTLKGAWAQRGPQGSPPSPSEPLGSPYQVGTDSHRSGTEIHVSAKDTGGLPRLTPRLPPLSKSYPSRAIGIATVMWLAAIASIATADTRPDLRAYPTGAVAALDASSGVLLNEYDWGGYLIWSVPGRPVFVDGRLYPFAGNGVISAYQTAIHVLPGWRGVISKWNVSQILVRPDRALVQALRDDGWVVRAQDERSVLLERPR